jgi:hypothetical protein
VLPLGSVAMSGTAADNTGIGNVEVAVQDFKTGLWWDATDASWEATKTFGIASYTATNAPATSVNWKFIFAGTAKQGQYLAEVRSLDQNGNVSQSVIRSFAMTGATAPPVPPPPTTDTTRPDGRLLFPAPPPQPAANLPLGTVHFTGDASDNVGVTSVKVALKRNSDGRWWTGTGSTGFGTTYTTFDATLGTPGGTSTTWSWDWLPKAAGSYSITVEARDAAGNVDSSKPNVTFNVTSDAPDTAAPETTIATPDDGATLPSGALTMTGTATDDKQVTGVRLSINNSLGQYWTGSAWSTTPTTVNATVSGSGTPSATWSYAFNGTAGSYMVSATAVDASNNLDSTPASRSFSMAGAPDTTAPSPTVTTPAQVNATVTGTTVNIGGNVTDNVGTTAVRITIQDTVSKLWWTGSGWGAFTNIPTTLAAPGSSSTTWSYTFTPPATGKYGYQVTAVDGAGNVSAKTAWRTVTMQ